MSTFAPDFDISRGIQVFSGKKLLRRWHALDQSPAGAEELYQRAIADAATVRNGWIRYWTKKS